MLVAVARSHRPARRALPLRRATAAPRRPARSGVQEHLEPLPKWYSSASASVGSAALWTDAHTVRGVRRPCRTRRVGRAPHKLRTSLDHVSAHQQSGAAPPTTWIQSCAAAWFCPPGGAQRHHHEPGDQLWALHQKQLFAPGPEFLDSYLGDAADTLLLPS